jgi:exodeoxyribonuclease V gamma subunit
MMPDIEKYAPYIGAVFEGCQDPAKKIPYSIADRSARREGQLIEVFLKILGLYGSRFGQTQVWTSWAHLFSAVWPKARAGVRTALVRRPRIRWGVDGQDLQPGCRIRGKHLEGRT